MNVSGVVVNDLASTERPMIFRRRPRISRYDWQLAAEQSQPRDLPGFDDGIALTELLDKIPGDRREVFVLTQLAGVPYAQTAAQLGCPVGTVRSRVARARTTLVTLLTT